MESSLVRVEGGRGSLARRELNRKGKALVARNGSFILTLRCELQSQVVAREVVEVVKSVLCQMHKMLCVLLLKLIRFDRQLQGEHRSTSFPISPLQHAI